MLKRSNYATFQASNHLIALTKKRRPVFRADIIKRLKQVLIEISEGIGARVIAIPVEKDHICLLLRSGKSASDIEKMVFSVASMIMRKEFPHLELEYPQQLLDGKLYTLHQLTYSFCEKE